MRENAATKSRRYLTEGRLIVEHVNRHEVTATCRGDGAIHSLGAVVAVDLREPV